MKTVDLTKGPVFSVLIALALPIIGSSLLQYTYSLVDMLLVGRLGYDAVASIGAASTLINIGYALNACIVVGSGIKVAHAIGAKDDVLKSRYINAGFRLNVLLALIFGIFMIVIGRPFLSFLSLEGEIAEMSFHYILVSVPMMILAFGNLWFTRLYNSFGSNKSALKISAVGVILNIILDILFIYGLNLGVVGAGLATMFANLVMLVLFFKQSRELFSITLSKKCEREDYQEIVRLGAPYAIQRLLFTLINVVLARFIANYGAEAIAAQKISLQIESVTFMVIGGLNGSISAFVGQNYGAKETNRIYEGVKVALALGVTYALMTTIALYFGGRTLTSLFVTDEQTIHIAAQYLKIVGLSQIFMACELVLNGVFTGIGLPKIPATISIIFTLLRIPLAIMFMPLFGIDGVWLSIAISSAIKGCVALTMYYFKVRRGDQLVTTH